MHKYGSSTSIKNVKAIAGRIKKIRVLLPRKAWIFSQLFWRCKSTGAIADV
ncbi:MAG: hypothetical protein ACK6BN_00535 [Pseudanabaena sp.]|uniref:hypothetical protein n=1 Tax=Pseudanabaena mucicola TaxID=71190 RepID=UPI0025789A43|nr:hypothetical protein [Pseudanabaena mucicola]MCA6583523.1 hypothetical protein [Pseudanabaena sp. M34BS1SP1A06MG]MCA6585339.1 hypothetical protein [Pseudanabaena sp. M051S1SP1A06QC]MCA6591455.1 hypothetical protein [Pseudanabaena sp. M38BS1SP1A06MG]MCE2976713.1 hypothetical protein [Pseudanabaena sp. CoA8_M7]